VLVGDVPHASIRDGFREVVTGLGMQCEREEVSPTRVNMWGTIHVPAVEASVRVKFEVNCADIDPVFDLVRLRHGVNTRVWKEEAEILTFQAPELLGTKFRALAQRSAKPKCGQARAAALGAGGRLGCREGPVP